jgi:hypothetical protein
MLLLLLLLLLILIPPSQASPRRSWTVSTPTRTTQTQTHATRYAAAVVTLAAATQLLSMPCDAVTPTDSTAATPSSNS